MNIFVYTMFMLEYVSSTIGGGEFAVCSLY